MTGGLTCITFALGDPCITEWARTHAGVFAHWTGAAGEEQASALEGNPQEHQWLLASRTGCQALLALHSSPACSSGAAAVETSKEKILPEATVDVHATVYCQYLCDHMIDPELHMWLVCFTATADVQRSAAFCPTVDLPSQVSLDPGRSRLRCHRGFLPGPLGLEASPPQRMPRR